MDSGNSGSIESSSSGGGSRGRGRRREDQELESGGAETISAFINNNNNNNPTSFSSFHNPSQLYSLNHAASFSADHHHHHQQQHQLPNYNVIGNDSSGGGDINNSLGMAWPTTYSFQLDDDDANNCTSRVTNQQFNTCATQSHHLPPLPVPTNMESAQGNGGGGGGGGGGGRSNPKKRSRASRRTPTTVLTTDTNNFRQMVQDFTGIPASPFETAFTAHPTKLGLFRGLGIQLPMANNGSSSSSSILDDVCSSTIQPPHLIRPFAIPNTYPKVIDSSSFLPRPFSVTGVEKFHVSGFQQGDPTPSRGPKATDSLMNMNRFALGHNTTATTATTTRTAMVDKDAPAPAPSENHGVVTKGQKGDATVESWICSSD